MIGSFLATAICDSSDSEIAESKPTLLFFFDLLFALRLGREAEAFLVREADAFLDRDAEAFLVWVWLDMVSSQEL